MAIQKKKDEAPLIEGAEAPKKKRGRKPKKGMYFGEREEKAVVLFLTSETQVERDLIYNEFLKAPLTTMVESIIRRYKLYRKTVSYEDLHADTLSHLITKTDKFDPSKGNKAYSYYGTICRNYIVGLLQNDSKVLKKNVAYEDVYKSIEQDVRYSYELDDNDTSYLTQLINDISSDIKNELILNDEGKLKKTLNTNEIKVGKAVINILDNWKVIFENLDLNDKYNKNSFYSTVREYTNLETKDVRNAMKRYKRLYMLIKQTRIEDGLI